MPLYLDRHKLALTSRIAVVLRMSRKRKTAAGVDGPDAAHAEKSLRSRLPLLQVNLRELLTAISVQM
ncbi:hypothetical protein WM28_12470 [Burkholderia ubonensis]|nr:hypothetical protein WM28_12470 [Burkholderia ubonensis]